MDARRELGARAFESSFASPGRRNLRRRRDARFTAPARLDWAAGVPAPFPAL